MKVGVERLEDSRIELSISVEAKALEGDIDEVIRKLSQRSNIPGFRRGKVPRSVIERRFGKDAILAQAFEEALPRLADEAMAEVDKSPMGTPALSDLEFGDDGSFEFKLSYDVFPEVELGEYKGIEIEEEEIIISDELIEQNLKELQTRHTEVVLSERTEVMDGDVVIGSFELFIGGEPEFETPKDFGIKVAEEMDITEFNGQLIGAKRDVPFEFTATISEEFALYYELEGVAGEDGLFKVVVKEIKEQLVPELNDDFAKDVGEFETLDELKADLESKISEVMERETRNAMRQKLVDALVDSSSCELPKTLLDEYINDELGSLKFNLQSRGLDYDDYLSGRGFTEETYKEVLLPEARQHVKTSLVLGALADQENVEVTDEDVEEEVKVRIGLYSAELQDDIEEFYENPKIREQIKQYLLGEKVIDLLDNNAKKVKKGDNLDDLSTDSSRTD